MRLLLALLLACLWSYPASAATTAQKAAGSVLNLYVCSIRNAGVLPYLCADFRHSVYVLNGVRYPTFTAMGGTVPGGCAIAAGTGASCSSTAFISIPAANPTAYMLVTDGVFNTAATSVGAAVFTTLVRRMSDVQSTTTRIGGTNSAACSGTVLSSGLQALFTSGSGIVCSQNGSAVQTATGFVADPAATLDIAGVSSLTFPVVAPFYVRSVRIYAGSYTNAQVQIASTQ